MRKRRLPISKSSPICRFDTTNTNQLCTRNTDMAAIDTPRVQLLAGANGRIGQFFASLQASLTAWNDARITRNALAQLSDRELEDIGLCRGDIDGIATQR
jgi:uncharacterized protein YjiS (DUF1127 family)